MNKCKSIRLRLLQQAESYDRRQARAAKRAATWADALRYDEQTEDDNGNPQESHLLSDGGRGAEKIREAGEAPLWKQTLEAILETYSKAERRRIEAIADCKNLSEAARAARTSRTALQRLKVRLSRQLGVVLELRRHQ